MTPDSQLHDIRGLVADGERLRLELLGLLTVAGPEERGALVTELAMFYGQAFSLVCAGLLHPNRAGESSDAVLLETAHGMAIQTVWCQEDTPISHPEQLDRLAECWRRITRIVLPE